MCDSVTLREKKKKEEEKGTLVENIDVRCSFVLLYSFLCEHKGSKCHSSYKVDGAKTLALGVEH